MQIAGSLFSIFGMPYLVAVTLHKQLIDAGINLPFPAIMIVGIIGLLTVGWLYDITGMWSKENGYSFKRNEEWNKMRTQK